MPSRIVLVMQGGGAPGCYQAGAYQALHESGIEPDWVIGTSIGAPLAPEINGRARMPVLSGQRCRSRSATFDRRIAAADHSRETGSIATACLTRSSSPLSPTTHSRSNGDFPEPGD
jgi:hypothetical protein